MKWSVQFDVDLCSDVNKISSIAIIAFGTPDYVSFTFIPCGTQNGGKGVPDSSTRV